MNNKEFKKYRKNKLEDINISVNAYNLIIGAIVLCGIMIDLIIAYFFTNFICNLHPILTTSAENPPLQIFN